MKTKQLACTPNTIIHISSCAPLDNLRLSLSSGSHTYGAGDNTETATEKLSRNPLPMTGPGKHHRKINLPPRHGLFPEVQMCHSGGQGDTPAAWPASGG